MSGSIIATFTKAYDGIVDMKAGSTNVTLSWCKYTGDDGATNTNSFVWQQINSLEATRASHTFLAISSAIMALAPPTSFRSSKATTKLT